MHQLAGEAGTAVARDALPTLARVDQVDVEIGVAVAGVANLLMFTPIGTRIRPS